MIQRRFVSLSFVVVVLSAAAWSDTPGGTILAALPEDTAISSTKPGPARVAATVEFDEKIDYYFESDIGLLHAYGSSQLATFDLLDADKPAVTITVPGANKAGAILHLSATPDLLISSAKSGLLVSPSGPLSKGESSYGLDVLEGTMIWERPVLPVVHEILTFPESGTAILRSGRKGNDFAALDYRTGDILWSEKIVARATWSSGGYLEVLGEETCTIEPRSGRRLRETGIKVSQKAIAAVYPELERFVFQKKGKNFVAYSLPEISPSDSRGGTIPSAEQLWEFESASHMMGPLDATLWGGRGIHAVPGDRFLVRSAFFSEMLDFSNGERKWIMKNTDLRLARGKPYSTDGKYGVGVLKDGFKVFDMDTGESIRDLAHSGGNNVHWIDENDGLIMWRDSRGRRTIRRFSADSGTLLWSATLPSLGYRLGGRLNGVMVWGPAATPLNNPVFYSAPNWRVKPNLRFVTPLDEPFFEFRSREGGPRVELFGDAGAREPLSTSEGRALQRFRRRNGLRPVEVKEMLFVTGSGDHYAIVGLDVTTGEQRRLAMYKAVPVHSIDPYPRYGLAIALENDTKTIKLLDWRVPDQ